MEQMRQQQLMKLKLKKKPKKKETRGPRLFILKIKHLRC